MREVMNEAQVRKVLDKAGQHNHQVRSGAKWNEVVLEKGCPRCEAIERLLKRSGT